MAASSWAADWKRARPSRRRDWGAGSPSQTSTKPGCPRKSSWRSQTLGDAPTEAKTMEQQPGSARKCGPTPGGPGRAALHRPPLPSTVRLSSWQSDRSDSPANAPAFRSATNAAAARRVLMIRQSNARSRWIPRCASAKMPSPLCASKNSSAERCLRWASRGRKAAKAAAGVTSLGCERMKLRKQNSPGSLETMPPSAVDPSLCLRSLPGSARSRAAGVRERPPRGSGERLRARALFIAVQSYTKVFAGFTSHFDVREAPAASEAAEVLGARGMMRLPGWGGWLARCVLIGM
mmetsp:Transcript_67517/g.213657  ORF Transcript_67517/g.213657 Transcript_67517/m.213657 type:complete len:292 (-) Transcript_67517:26-901(-)